MQSRRKLNFSEEKRNYVKKTANKGAARKGGKG